MGIGLAVGTKNSSGSLAWPSPANLIELPESSERIQECFSKLEHA
jgi:hypothetical protein